MAEVDASGVSLLAGHGACGPLCCGKNGFQRVLLPLKALPLAGVKATSSSTRGSRKPETSCKCKHLQFCTCFSSFKSFGKGITTVNVIFCPQEALEHWDVCRSSKSFDHTKSMPHTTTGSAYWSHSVHADSKLHVASQYPKSESSQRGVSTLRIHKELQLERKQSQRSSAAPVNMAHVCLQPQATDTWHTAYEPLWLDLVRLPKIVLGAND